MIEEKIGRARLLKMAITGIDYEIIRSAQFMEKSADSVLRDDAAKYVAEISAIRSELISELAPYDKKADLIRYPR